MSTTVRLPAAPLLDRQQAERTLAGLSLPELLLRQGSMTGPYRITRPMTVTWKVRLARLLRSLVAHRR